MGVNLCVSVCARCTTIDLTSPLFWLVGWVLRRHVGPRAKDERKTQAQWVSGSLRGVGVKWNAYARRTQTQKLRALLWHTSENGAYPSCCQAQPADVCDLYHSSVPSVHLEYCRHLVITLWKLRLGKWITCLYVLCTFSFFLYSSKDLRTDGVRTEGVRTKDVRT